MLASGKHLVSANYFNESELSHSGKLVAATANCAYLVEQGSCSITGSVVQYNLKWHHSGVRVFPKSSLELEPASNLPRHNCFSLRMAGIDFDIKLVAVRITVNSIY